MWSDVKCVTRCEVFADQVQFYKLYSGYRRIRFHFLFCFYMRWQIDQLWFLMMIREVGKYCVCVCENLNLKRLFVCFWMLLCVNQREINSSKLLYWMSYLRYEITWVVVTFKYLFHFWKERKKIWNRLECFILLLKVKLFIELLYFPELLIGKALIDNKAQILKYKLILMFCLQHNIRLENKWKFELFSLNSVDDFVRFSSLSCPSCCSR